MFIGESADVSHADYYISEYLTREMEMIVVTP
jgi:hypothetical protein